MNNLPLFLWDLHQPVKRRLPVVVQLAETSGVYQNRSLRLLNSVDLQQATHTTQDLFLSYQMIYVSGKYFVYNSSFTDLNSILTFQ